MKSPSVPRQIPSTTAAGPASVAGAKRRAAGSRSAFTLIELLTVIAIIGVLAAIVIPSMGAVKRQARMTKEISAAKQLMVAYLMFPNDNKGRLLGGRDDTGERFDETGQNLTGAGGMAGSSWVHRVRPYLGDRLVETLYVNEQADFYKELTKNGSSNVAYELALYTTMGMNMQGVGGGGEQITDIPVTRLNQSSFPAGLMVFASGHNRPEDPKAGFFHIYPPAGSWPSKNLTELPENTSLDNAYGWVAFRHSGKAVTAFLDGHVELLTCEKLRDMRLWSERAREQNNPNYRPRAQL